MLMMTTITTLPLTLKIYQIISYWPYWSYWPLLTILTKQWPYYIILTMNQVEEGLSKVGDRKTEVNNILFFHSCLLDNINKHKLVAHLLHHIYLTDISPFTCCKNWFVLPKKVILAFTLLVLVILTFLGWGKEFLNWRKKSGPTKTFEI